MGAVGSKGDHNTPLLNLCKERKDLIKAARDARYDLAKSHLLYFHSLLDFTKILNQFVHEDLEVLPFSDDDSSTSDLNCCGSDLDSDSDTDGLGCDLSQKGSLKKNSVKQDSTPELVPVSKEDQHPQKPVSEDKQTCGSSNKVNDHQLKEDLGLSQKKFVSIPDEDVVRAPDQNSVSIGPTSIPDIFGLYGDPCITQCGFTEPDQRDDEVESDGLREVREREGIPDLESDTDRSSLIRKHQKKKKKKNGKKRSCSIASAAGGVDTKDVKFNNVQETSSVANLPGEFDKSNVEVAGESNNCTEKTKETPENVREVRSLNEQVCDEAYESSSSSSFLSDASSPGLTDLRSIVEKINGICQKVVSINSEVSKLLEVSKVVYHQPLPLGDQFKGFASRILGTTGNSTRTLLSVRGLSKEDSAGSLSITLEKLYSWEKKLYAEVTTEEKLSFLYDKAHKISTNLVQIGAEPNMIYEAEAAVKFHKSNIEVSLRTVEWISMRVHNIRDEELLFQVNRIINGFKEMWRLLAKCHHKQFQAIGRSKSCVHIVEKGSRSRKATHKVEEQIRRYRESLRGYIEAHRNFVNFLNEWLNRNIVEGDRTETEAPAIFRVCSEWLREIVNVDEVKLLSAVEEMELRFRGLGFKQVEEEKQRMRRQRVSKELERKAEPVANMMVEQELLSLREIVRQEKENHERVRREVNDILSTSLQECLVPVFEALEDFCFGNFKAYQNIQRYSIIV